MITNLEDLLSQGLLKKHNPSIQEVNALFKIIERDIKDAQVPYLSADRRFATAYNAALQLATIVLRAHGFRSNPGKAAHHRISIDTIPLILGKHFYPTKSYFDTCRMKRNACEYTSTEEASDKDVKELIETVKDFEQRVKKWLAQQHPELS